MKLPKIKIIICKKCMNLVAYFWNPKDEWMTIIKSVSGGYSPMGRNSKGESLLYGCKKCGCYLNEIHIGKYMFDYADLEILDLIKVSIDGEIPEGIRKKIRDEMFLKQL